MAQLTQEDIDELGQFINNDNRTGMYLRYYELTGSDQALEQAYISTFSEFTGGAADRAQCFCQKNR